VRDVPASSNLSGKQKPDPTQITVTKRVDESTAKRLRATLSGKTFDASLRIPGHNGRAVQVVLKGVTVVTTGIAGGWEHPIEQLSLVAQEIEFQYPTGPGPVPVPYPDVQEPQPKSPAK